MLRTTALVLVLMGALFVTTASVSAADERPAGTDKTEKTEGSEPRSKPGMTIGTIDSLPEVMRMPTRGMALPTLYVSLAGLQAYDGYSTLHGVSRSATEANPLVRGVAGNPTAMWAIKGTATFASIYVAEKLWRQHRRGQAIALMVASNALMLAVAAHNASVINAQR